jgi:hypothetical protein
MLKTAFKCPVKDAEWQDFPRLRVVSDKGLPPGVLTAGSG